MRLDTFLDAERYLMNKQVYFKKEIVDENFRTLAHANRVHDVKSVQLERLSKRSIVLSIFIDDETITIYNDYTDREMLLWIEHNLIPVKELVSVYNAEILITD